MHVVGDRDKERGRGRERDREREGNREKEGDRDMKCLRRSAPLSSVGLLGL